MAPDVRLSATASSTDPIPTVYPVFLGKVWLLQQCPIPTCPSTVTVWSTCISASVFDAGPGRSSVEVSIGDYTCRTAALNTSVSFQLLSMCRCFPYATMLGGRHGPSRASSFWGISGSPTSEIPSVGPKNAATTWKASGL